MQSWFRVTNNIDVMKLMIIPLHCKGSLFAWLKMCIRRVLALVTSIQNCYRHLHYSVNILWDII